ncbi:MAG TPA: hypothetical protein VME67_22730 [Mycobacterium sp.]|nr:hypothetical protein [Mycobacterium sp.]HTX97402.1 hypothetical protein [Mycobacterium sp.]
MTYRGLLYIKHGRLGTKSEGPDYWLQTADGEYLLRFHDRAAWEPDFELEFYNRRIVEVDGEQPGELDDRTISVTGLWALPVTYIPRKDTQPHLGDAIRLGLRERVALADAPVELELTRINDSRCPIGAFCIWAGEAVLDLEVTLDSATPEEIQLTLESGKSELAGATVGSYRIEAKRLDPYPVLHQMGSERYPTELEKSIATLVVTHPGSS